MLCDLLLSLVAEVGTSNHNTGSDLVQIMALMAELSNSESTSGKTHHRLKKLGPTEKDVEIGKRIRTLRIARNLTQARLAGMVGVAYQQIQKYEAGEDRVACSRIDDIAKALGCCVADFFPSGENMRVTDEALRLIEAFMMIANQSARSSLVTLAETLSQLPLGN